MKKKSKFLKASMAISVIGMGIIGLVFPIIPGIPLLLFGIYLLYPEKFKKWYHRVLSKFRRKS